MKKEHIGRRPLRKGFSLILVLAMILGIIQTAALPVFGEDSFEITVKVAPKTVRVQFYSGDDYTTPLDAVLVTDAGIDGNFYKYVLNVPAGTYSYTGIDGDYILGGEVFEISESKTINLLRANIRYNGASLNAEGDYTFTFMNDNTKKDVKIGTPYLSSNIRYTPTLLIAGDKHIGTTVINSKWDDDFYLTSEGSFTNTPSTTATTASNVNLPIVAYKKIVLTAPETADVSFYQQEKNFIVKTLSPDSVELKDGIKTYVFKSTAAHSNYQYRCSSEGAIVQAGYLKDGDKINIVFPEDRTPSSVISDIEYDDRSVILNIDDTRDTNKLVMQKDETFKLRAFRAAWEIVNTTSGNQMIEPDFHYSVLSGSDVITMNPLTESDKGAPYCNGNAGNNWTEITALKAGVAILDVSYDAIDVYGANPATASGITRFGASDPAREGVVVVTVGNSTDIEWNPVSSDGDWDAEFDTVYYIGSEGSFVIAPEDVNSVTVQNVYGGILGEAVNVSKGADGKWSVPVKTGANIIAASTEDGTDYMVVRARQVSYTITNNTTGLSCVESAPFINVGDSVTISFSEKFDMPIPKMSGIYNPGYLGTAKTAYVINGKYVVKSNGTQYEYSLPEKNSLSFTAYVAGENKLSGYISLSSMGDEFGNHRNLTDEGRQANTNAAEIFGQFGILPEISFNANPTMYESDPAEQYEKLTKVNSVIIYAGPSTYLNGFITETSPARPSAPKDNQFFWSKTTSDMSAYPLNATVTTNDYYNTILLRYWYDGETVHEKYLTSGINMTIPQDDEFKLDADKILNIEVIVTPEGGDISDAKAYCYTVCPGNSNLQYVHPVIKSFSIYKPDGGTLDVSSVYGKGARTTVTDYELDCAHEENISLGANMLQKYTNTTNNKQDNSDTVEIQRYSAGIATGEAITVLPLSEVKYPVGKFSVSPFAITGCDEIKLTVTSYVTSSAIRTYSIKLKNVGPEEEPEVQPSPGEELSNEITVSFRLIGSEQASSDVDLSAGSYIPAYVNWIKTKTYTLDKGSTVADLFIRAINDAGLTQIGADSDYVSSITAPECFGGYALGEFDNGAFSGWMYTVNGKHPGRGLKNRVLKDNDVVIWHYVNDYRYEVADWYAGSRGTRSQQSRWLMATDKNPWEPEPEIIYEEDLKTKDTNDKKLTPAAVFADVKESDWFAPYVNKARELKIMEGVGDNKFDPKGKFSKSMMIQILYNLEGRPEISGETPFKDIKAGSWYEKATIWAYKNGIIKGNGSEFLNPSGDITRAELLTMLYRYAGLKNLNVTSSGSIDTFNDYKKVKSWAEDAFKWAVGKEIVEGTDLNTLEPVSDAIRAEAAKIMVKFVETK